MEKKNSSFFLGGMAGHPTVVRFFGKTLNL